MHVGPPEECRVVPRLINDLRAALDAEPKPSPTNEERARELAWNVLVMSVDRDEVERNERHILAALAAAEARGLERARGDARVYRQAGRRHPRAEGGVMTNEERATEINKRFGRCNPHQMNIIIMNALNAAESRGLERAAKLCDERGIEHAANEAGCDDHGRTILAAKSRETCLCAAAIRALKE